MRCLFFLLLSVTAYAQHTYYISKSTGLDTRTSTQARSKSTPWAHLPGMTSCSSNCNSYSPVAGDQFILMGGDHWVASDMPVNFNSNGASGSPIYIGVDQTWFSGSAWTRPIFDCQATNCNPFSGMIEIGGSYVTVDNIEIIGIRFTVAGGTMKAIQTTADHTIIEHNYVHGWSHDPSFSSSNDNGRGFAFAANTSGGGGAGVGVVVHDNVVDGQDTTQDMMGGADDSETVYNNVFRYVYNCVRGAHTYVYNNLCEYIVIEGWPNADHANGISIFDTFSGSTMWVYNNVVRHTTASALGSETMWLHSLGDATGETTYVFNNLLYDNGRGIDIGDHPTAGSGTSYFYNNTVEAGGNHCFGNGETSPRGTLNYANNHCINASTICDGTGVSCTNLGGNLSQTSAQATTAGYTASQSYGYFPTTSSGSTVGIGNSLTSSCVTIGIALCSGTSYPEYDAVHHVPIFSPVIARGSSWDAGAYKYTAPGSANGVPTNLQQALASEGSSGSSITSNALPLAVRQGNAIVGFVWTLITTANPITGVTTNQGDNCLIDSASVQVTSSFTQAMFYCLGVTGGAGYTATATFSGSSSYNAIWIGEYSGVGGYDSGTHSTGSNAASMSVSSFTPTVGNALAVCGGIVYGSGAYTYTASGAFQQRHPGANSRLTAIADQLQTTPAPITSVFTTDQTTEWGLSCTSFATAPWTAANPYVISSAGYINPSALSSHTGAPFSTNNTSASVCFVGTHNPWNTLSVSITGVSDIAGNTWNLIAGPTLFNGANFPLLGAVYEVLSPLANAADKLTVSVSNPAPMVIDCESVANSSGAAVVSAINAPASGGSSTSVTSGPITTAANALLMQWAKNENPVGGFPAASAFSMDWGATANSATGGYLWPSWQTQSAGGSYSGNYTYPSANGWQSVILGFVPTSMSSPQGPGGGKAASAVSIGGKQ